MNTQKTHINYSDFSSDAIADLLLQSIASVREFAAEKGYPESGDFPDHRALTAALSDTSQSMDKRLIKGHFRLKRKLSMRSANRFLHQICAKLLEYGTEKKIPRIDYSEKETAIKASRAAWVKARDEAEALRLAYVEEKGDYYRS